MYLYNNHTLLDPLTVFVYADDDDVSQVHTSKVDSIINSISVKSNTVGQSAATSQGDYI